MTLREALRQGESLLVQGDVPAAHHDASALMAGLLRVPRLSLPLESSRVLTPAQETAYFGWIARRAEREPLQYILGTQWFMGYDIAVAPGVLIPRADTETLAEQAILRLAPSACVLDLCTGSGALAIALAKCGKDARVWAGDVSAEALAVARANAARHEARIHFRQGDFFLPFVHQRFDMIVCNPPYIPSAALAGLQAEVRFEPSLALDGGDDGLHFYRRLFSEAPDYLNRNGQLLVELGDGQEAYVTMLAAASFADISVYNDLGGVPRVLAAVLKGGRDAGF